LKATLLANDTDVDNDTLSISAVSSATPAGASVSIAGSFVVYVAPAINSGDGSFVYTVSDGAATATATVTVTETSPPPSTSGPNATIRVVAGNIQLTFLGVPGRQYRVQYTTSLVQPIVWNEFSPQAIYTAPPNGVILHTDPNPPGPMRFYRIVAHP